MSPDQVSLVRGSWPTVAANAELLTIQFYEHLFDIDHSAARLFAGVDMAVQRTRLAQALTVVIKSLDDPDRLLPAIAALGRRHAGYGVTHEHFTSVGDALLWALTDVLGGEFTPPVRDAWAEAYATVASVMRRALYRAAETVPAAP
jgi:hemoglobin-like flavoprotein